MFSGHSTLTIVLVLGVLCLSVVAIIFLLRQVFISKKSSTVETFWWAPGNFFRREDWRYGILQYGSKKLAWFRGTSFSPWPAYFLRREDIASISREMFTPSNPKEKALQQLIVRECQITVTLHDGKVIYLLMDELSYNGFAAWLEAAPAGTHVTV